MSFEVWLAFVAAASLLLVTPGPTTMLVISYGLGEGRRFAWATVAGVVLGDFVAMSLSLLGMGAVLAASATLFTILKWAGAAYLVYVGIRIWRASVAAPQAAAAQLPRSAHAMLGHAFTVTALNPKGIVFFVAFLPQFIDPASVLPPQLALLMLTFLVLAAVNAAAYAMLAGSMHAAVRRPWLLRLINRVAGTILIGAGVATAALRRTS